MRRKDDFFYGNTDMLVGHKFGNLLCTALGRPAFISVGKIAVDDSLLTLNSWAGGFPTEFSRAPYVAQCKLAELYLHGAAIGLSLTPVPGFEMELRWMGGARFDSTLVAVSKWAQEHDRLLALILLYGLIKLKNLGSTWPLYLHHVGFSFNTDSEANQSSAIMAEKGGYKKIAVSYGEGRHSKDYLVVPNSNLSDIYGQPKYDKSYIQIDCCPSDTIMTHLDIVVENPEEFLNFIADAYGVKPIIIPRDCDKSSIEPPPVGCVWIEAASDKSKLGVMARKEWWEITEPNKTLIDLCPWMAKL